MRNIDRYKDDFKDLSEKGFDLYTSLISEISPHKLDAFIEASFPDDDPKVKKNKLPLFVFTYQTWYTEASMLIKQLMPDRLDDFKSYYAKPKGRKSINVDTYRIEDYLQGLSAPSLDTQVVLSHMMQQLAILNAVKKRFTSSLFDIQKLVQSDLYDNELEAAKDLNNKKFHRAAGAIAGVVLERHLKEVCRERKVNLKVKNPTISALNEALKDQDIIDLPTWRHITLLGDIRNECSHSKDVEPTKDKVDDLIQGVDKIIKTVF